MPDATGPIPRRSEPPAKVMTLRLAQEQAENLKLVAEVDGHPMADAVRMAINAYVDARRTDPHWQERLAENVDAKNAAIRRLRSGGSS